ncbi:hypothetical protein QWA68_003439 [Fusarium oxysporum]|nr:hypothetical protein QWA68_003439 [Fusarium oxysporum]
MRSCDATLAKSSQRRRCDLPADYVVSTKPFLEKIRLEARKAMMPTLLNDFQEGILKFILEKEFTEDQHDVVWQVAHKRFQQNVASWKSQTLALIKYKIEELELSAETRNQNGDVAFSIPWRTLRLSLLGVITTQYTSVAKSGKKPSGLGLVLARWDEIWKSKKMENVRLSQQTRPASPGQPIHSKARQEVPGSAQLVQGSRRLYP